MTSIAKHTYPQMVWRDRVKKLWNPIQRKALKNRPEERVRLRVMESLIQAGWSKHRISTEEAIGELGDTSMRTDIICYTKEFEPSLLVECKAEYVSITSRTAEQVARYNQKVEAPYLLMTNGITDYWYEINDGTQEIKKLTGRPNRYCTESTKDYTFDEWKDRGFVGAKASPDLRGWVEDLLPLLWVPEEEAVIRFLSFSDTPSDVDLNHYYRIARVDENRRLAITTINTAYGGNRMVVILNEDDENKAVLEINLDLLFDEKKGNSSVYSRSGIQAFDLNKYLDLQSVSKVDALVEQVNNLLAEYIG